MSRGFVRNGDTDHVAALLGKSAAAFLNNGILADLTICYNGQEFKCNRALVSIHSDWFKTCLQGSWKENESSRIELHGDHPLAVEMMIQYMCKLNYNDAMPISGNETSYDLSEAYLLNTTTYHRMHGDAEDPIDDAMEHGVNYHCGPLLWDDIYKGESPIAATKHDDPELLDSFPLLNLLPREPISDYSSDESDTMEEQPDATEYHGTVLSEWSFPAQIMAMHNRRASKSSWAFASALECNVHMNSLGHKYQIPGLRHMALSKLRALLGSGWIGVIALESVADLVFGEETDLPNDLEVTKLVLCAMAAKIWTNHSIAKRFEHLPLFVFYFSHIQKKVSAAARYHDLPQCQLCRKDLKKDAGWEFCDCGSYHYYLGAELFNFFERMVRDIAQWKCDESEEDDEEGEEDEDEEANDS